MEDNFPFAAVGVAIIVVVILGCVGNIMSLFVLSRLELRSSINCCLQGLAVFDTLLIITSLFVFGFHEVGMSVKIFQRYNEYVYPRMVPILYPLAHIARTGSVWTTVIVTVERFVAVCHPLKARSICTCSRTRYCNLFILLFSISYNVPRFFELKIEEYHLNDTNNSTILIVQATDFRLNIIYYEIYYVGLNIIFIYIVPFGMLIALNMKIWLVVKRANQNRQYVNRNLRKEIKLALMLFCIVVIFFFCHSLALTAAILEYLKIYKVLLVKISDFMVTFNSSVNFIIYCIFGKKFRKVFLSRFWKRSTQNSNRTNYRDRRLVNLGVKFRNGKSSIGFLTFSINKTTALSQ